MEKDQLIEEIGNLETDLSTTEGDLRKSERQFDSLKGNRTSGSVVLLLGLIGIIFFSDLWYVWYFLIAIGGLTFLTAIKKQNAIKLSIKTYEDNLSKIRSKLAESRAELISQ